MGNCIYCKKSAGLFSKKHLECEQLFNEGIKLLIEYTDAFFMNDSPIEFFQERIKILSENYLISEEQILLNTLKSWGKSVNSIIKDHKVNEELLHKLFLFQEIFIIKNLNGLEKAFGKVNLEVGRKYKYYYDEYEFIKEIGKLYMCKNQDGKIKFANPSLLKYYEKIEKHTEKAILYLLDFQESFFINFLKDDFRSKIDAEEIKEKIEFYRNLLFVENESLKYYVNESFIGYILYLREEVSLNELDEPYIVKVKSVLGIETDDFNEKGAYSKLVQLFILKDIEDGKFPKRVTVTNDIPFNLQNDEKVIWLSNFVELYEEQTLRHYEGGHLGMSFRIANGMYLRAGEFKGRPVETTKTKFITNGIVRYTNKHVYFFSFKKSFKIRYDKIISVIPRTNGVIIMKDGDSSKPVILKNEDGVFVYNLITSLTKAKISI